MHSDKMACAAVSYRDLEPCRGISKKQPADVGCIATTRQQICYTADAFDEKVELHRGRHSTVWSAQCRLTNELVVLKAYNTQRLKPRQLVNVQREIELLTLLNETRTPGVVTLLAHFQDPEHIYLVFEACMRGDLYQVLIKEKGKLTEEYVSTQVVVPLLITLSRLHSRGIIHRDVKPENIFISLDNSLILGDFGLAALKSKDKLTERVGTLDYMAPEVLSMPTPDEATRAVSSAAAAAATTASSAAPAPPSLEPYTEAVDVWAVGILVFELLTGKPPFEVEDPKETAKLILGAQLRHEDFPPGVSKEAREFVLGALAKKGSARPSAKELMAHPWVAKNLQRQQQPAAAATGGAVVPLPEVQTPSKSEYKIQAGRGTPDPSPAAPQPAQRKPQDQQQQPQQQQQQHSALPAAHAYVAGQLPSPLSYAVKSPAVKSRFGGQQQPASAVKYGTSAADAVQSGASHGSSAHGKPAPTAYNCAPEYAAGSSASPTITTTITPTTTSKPLIGAPVAPSPQSPERDAAAPHIPGTPEAQVGTRALGPTPNTDGKDASAAAPGGGSSGAQAGADDAAAAAGGPTPIAWQSPAPVAAKRAVGKSRFAS